MKKSLHNLVFIISIFAIGQLSAQYPGWQQDVKYVMNVELDSDKHTFKGVQRLTWTNNSPEHIDKAFFHLYFNAFQPGSMMDVRSRTIVDPDKRVGDRILQLSPEEQGHLHVKEMKMNGAICTTREEGTILEVTLPESIAPGDSAIFDLVFEGQVPLQIRRSGRDNREGIDYSMSQWYPKICAYDHMGWHTTPYIGREFFGTFGSFDVTLWTSPELVVGATGYLIEEAIMKIPSIGKKERSINEKKKWRFVADHVHDFVWSADRGYRHTVYTTKDSVEIHCYFVPTERNESSWEALPEIMEEALLFINKRYGKYPFKKYSFIQGGDGGMEYPMATLITGERSLSSLVGVSVHELMHHWYYMVLGNNETIYPWMDEGFTSFASSEVMNHLKEKGKIPGNPVEDPLKGSYENYRYFSQTGQEEALATPADHFQTNNAYGDAAYTKGALFLAQLEYIVGKDVFDAALFEYYRKWQFKHPGPWDCLRVFEEASGMELDWFVHYWVNTTYTIDYGIDSVRSVGESSVFIDISRNGEFPMPLDFKVNLIDGRTLFYTIPLVIQRGEKTRSEDIEFNPVGDWPWVDPHESVQLPFDLQEIESIQLNPQGRLADIDKSNDTWPPYDHSKRN